MMNIFKSWLPCVAVAVALLVLPCVGFADGVEPELPSDFGFDVTGLFASLLGYVMPGLAAAIGFAASIWAVGLLWRAVKGVAR